TTTVPPGPCQVRWRSGSDDGADDGNAEADPVDVPPRLPGSCGPGGPDAAGAEGEGDADGTGRGLLDGLVEGSPASGASAPRRGPRERAGPSPR
ncbi:MAG TPA: hypothetical protein VF728_07830, partial [Nocardioides sp.]